MEKENQCIWDIDPYLLPYQKDLNLRSLLLQKMKEHLLGDRKSLTDFANGYLHYGFHPGDPAKQSGWIYREWAPNAIRMTLFGDFNNWNRTSHPLRPAGGGNWELQAPGPLPHGSKVRIQITTPTETLERIPLYCKRAVQNPQTHAFDGQIWHPENPFPWNDQTFRPKDEPLLIYECHIGIAGEEPRVASYAEFTERVLPRIKKLGYNTIQLMAVMEHPYYGSFGYQVANFFAASSRFGTPEDLKGLVNAAHEMGLAVLLDLVHSHAASNELEGPARFDGTTSQFFHPGPKGVHPQWGTKLFNYAKPEVIHFLLSNLKFWLTEYHFDGFRFDGVTSMLYHDHGLGSVFDHYRKYFSLNTDTDAVTYLQLATTLCKEIKPHCLLIAEDMSGMPGMCLPVQKGGIGFDYRLSMGVPDFWIKTLKEQPDEDWNIGQLWHELTQRRPQEKVIGYCESHDQALVGDKTIMFWLADQEMYWHMKKESQSPAIDRAMALHKMIRLVTCLCAGEGYLNFMGNEFGHPEWIDFPRAGNNYSYHYARRQWSLADNEHLRYHYLHDFDQAMLELLKDRSLLAQPSRQLWLNETDKVLVFAKGPYLCVFNFHPTKDAFLHLPLPEIQEWKEVLHTNWTCFGGYRSLEPSALYSCRGDLPLQIDCRAAAIFIQG